MKRALFLRIFLSSLTVRYLTMFTKSWTQVGGRVVEHGLLLVVLWQAVHGSIEIVATIAGYLTFGDKTAPNLLTNYAADDPWILASRVMALQWDVGTDIHKCTEPI